MRASKGSSFERAICKQLSIWWTKALEGKGRDDVFWRSSQSGGRATLRARKGLRTAGSYGDITAVDPIGEPLLKLFTIELKRGSSYSCAGDCLDSGGNSKHPWWKCLEQAVDAHLRAGSKYWMLLCRRDRREAVVYIPATAAKDLGVYSVPPFVYFKYSQIFVGVTLQNFLKSVSPGRILESLGQTSVNLRRPK